MHFCHPVFLSKIHQFTPIAHQSCNGVYCLRLHDSLKISNGKWYWWSRGIGGRSALDYLIEVEGIPLVEAVQRINAMEGIEKSVPSIYVGSHTNLGKYNEGELVGEWVSFPVSADEMKAVLDRIQIGHPDDFGIPYEEIFI